MSTSQRIYRGLTPDQRRARRRAALLEAALDAVADPDVEVSVRTICAKSGLTPRYFYESFPSLDDLLVGLVSQIGGEIFAAGEAAVRAVEDRPLVEQCRAAFSGGFELLKRDARRAEALLVLASGRDVLQERRRQFVIEYSEGAMAMVAERYDLGGISPHAARSTLLFAVAGTFELVLAHLGGSLDITEDELADDVARLMAQCLRLLDLPFPE